MPTRHTIRAYLEPHLKRCNVNVTELHRRTGIKRDTISRYRFGKTTEFSVHTLETLAEALDCRPRDLLVEDTDMEKAYRDALNGHVILAMQRRIDQVRGADPAPVPVAEVPRPALLPVERDTRGARAGQGAPVEKAHVPTPRQGAPSEAEVRQAHRRWEAGTLTAHDHTVIDWITREWRRTNGMPDAPIELWIMYADLKKVDL